MTNSPLNAPPRTDADRERSLRRLAGREGLAVRKSRTRNPTSPEWQTYMLVDPGLNSVVVACGLPSGFGLSLDELEDALDIGARLTVREV